jgi:cytidine deaminase
MAHLEGAAMSAEDDELIARAVSARGHAYAPYSNYAVGAAVRADDGRIFAGANVENASYGLSLCAERAAVAQAANAGVRRLVAAAVVTASSPPAAPCGMCRQTLAELAADLAQVRVLLANDRGERAETTLAELLPRAFRPADLPGAGATKKG